MIRRTQITRRSFIASAGAAVVGSRVAWGQQKAWRVALAAPILPIDVMRDDGPDLNWRLFMTELRALGLMEGVNVTYERYSASGDAPRYPELGKAIAATKPDLVFVGSSTSLTLGAAGANPNLPVVFQVGDALSTGLVSNLAHPGGNLTGANSTSGYDVEGKRIALMLEMMPGARRIGYLVSNEKTPVYLSIIPIAQEAARQLGLEYVPMWIDPPFDDATFQRAFNDAVRMGVPMFAGSGTTPITGGSQAIGALSVANRIPGITANPEFAAAGGLMSYGPAPGESYRRAAAYVVRILNGERAGDLPVTMPDKYLLTVNMKTAKRLGVAVPGSLMLQVTDVIE